MCSMVGGGEGLFDIRGLWPNGGRKGLFDNRGSHQKIIIFFSRLHRFYKTFKSVKLTIQNGKNIEIMTT